MKQRCQKVILEPWKLEIRKKLTKKLIITFYQAKNKDALSRIKDHKSWHYRFLRNNWGENTNCNTASNHGIVDNSHGFHSLHSFLRHWNSILFTESHNSPGIIFYFLSKFVFNGTCIKISNMNLRVILVFTQIKACDYQG